MNKFFAKLFGKQAKNDVQTSTRPFSRAELQAAGVDMETLAWTKSFVVRYGAALRELADK